MSNKRIQKKRAKARLIASVLELDSQTLTGVEWLRRARWLWKLSIPELLNLSYRVIYHVSAYTTPLRRAIPRKEWSNE